MLTTEEMQRITQEVVTGRESTIAGSEANEFRNGIERDFKEAKKLGQELVIPSEWEIS